jgi:hypothetical protein
VLQVVPPPILAKILKLDPAVGADLTKGISAAVSKNGLRMGYGPSAWRVSAMGRRPARRADTAVSPATEMSVPSTAVMSHQAGGWLAFAPWLAAVNRP